MPQFPPLFRSNSDKPSTGQIMRWSQFYWCHYPATPWGQFVQRANLLLLKSLQSVFTTPILSGSSQDSQQIKQPQFYLCLEVYLPPLISCFIHALFFEGRHWARCWGYHHEQDGHDFFPSWSLYARKDRRELLKANRH